jgi:quercetin 2,3-dioxygenase
VLTGDAGEVERKVAQGEHMKSSWQSVIWIAIGLISGPVAVSAVWLLAAMAAEVGFVVLPDSAPRFYGPKGREEDITEIIATRDQTGGLLGLFRQTVAPKSGPATHIHKTEDEFFYVVKGEFKVKLGDRIMNAPAQTVMFVPRGTPHAFQNAGTEPGVLLIGVTPGGFEKEMQERQGADAEMMKTLAKKYNSEVVGPPIQ